MLKRILCALLCACAVVTFASCGKKAEKKDGNTDKSGVETTVDAADSETSGVINPGLSNYTNDVTAAPKEKEEPATTPENYTVIEHDNEFKNNQIRFKEVSVAKIGGDYVINAIYATVQQGVYYARLVDHFDLFDTTGSIKQNAEGSAVQLDLPVSAAEAVPDGKIEIGFMLPNASSLDEYVVYLNVADIVANAKVVEVKEIDIPMDITLASQKDYVKDCKATFDGETYHFSFSYNISGNCKFNRTYPVNENSIVITADNSNLNDDNKTDLETLGKNDPSITGQGVFKFDVPASEVKNETVVTFRIYDDGNFMSATIGTLHIEGLGRLAK